MRVVIAMMKHETNTFSPVPTPLASFGRDGPAFGDDAHAAFRGTNTPMAAYIDLAEAQGAEIVTPIAAEAWPSGPVDGDAFNRMCDTICNAVAGGCDAVLLDLHGAMVSEVTDDGEGTLLERIRQSAPHIPIAVALDLHANLTERMVKNATAIAGYKTYPHVDMYQAGERAGQIVFGALSGRVEPVMAWDSRPMLPHTLRMGTDEPPMEELVDMAKSAESEGLLAATVFGGFPLADIPDAGLSTVVVADGDEGRAREVCDAILDRAWSRRADFVYHSKPLSESITEAKSIEQGPVLLIDHADNCASGGTQDTMAVVAEALRQGLGDLAVAAIRDPQAVAQMIDAGVGRRVRSHSAARSTCQRSAAQASLSS